MRRKSRSGSSPRETDLSAFEDAVILYDVRCPRAGRKGIESGFRSARDLKTSILHFPEQRAGRTPPICPELGRWMDRSHVGEQGRRGGTHRQRKSGGRGEGGVGETVRRGTDETRSRSSARGRSRVMVDCKFARFVMARCIIHPPARVVGTTRVKGGQEGRWWMAGPGLW